MPGKFSGVDATPVGTYAATLQVAATAERKEPLLEIAVGNRMFFALLDTGSSVSLFGDSAMAAAESAGAIPREEPHSVRLATGCTGTAKSV